MGKETVQSVERAIDLIEFLAVSGKSGVREIADQIELSSTVVHRLLQTLYDKGYVGKDQDSSKYYLTFKIVEISNAIIGNDEITRVVYPYLEKLSKNCNETVHFVEQSKINIRYLEKVIPDKNIHAMGSRIGQELPMVTTAVGKAILSERTDEEILSVWNQTELSSQTQYTNLDFNVLKEQIEETRRTALAYDFEERELGVVCIGVSLVDSHGACKYGISISGPRESMLIKKQENENYLLAAKEELSRIIGLIPKK